MQEVKRAAKAITKWMEWQRAPEVIVTETCHYCGVSIQTGKGKQYQGVRRITDGRLVIHGPKRCPVSPDSRHKITGL